MPGIPGTVSFLGMIQKSFALYPRARLVPVVGFFLANIISAAFFIAGVLLVEDDLSGAQIPVALVVLSVLPVVLGSMAVAASASAFEDAVIGEKPTWGRAFSHAASRWRELLTAGLLVSMISLFTSFLPLGPALAYAVLGPPILVHVIMLERATFQEAFPRSRELLAGQWGRATIYLAGWATLLWVIESTVAFGISEALDSMSDDGLAVFLAAFSAVTRSFWLPLLAGAMFVMYLDLRVRLEQLDVEQMREQVEAS